MIAMQNKLTLTLRILDRINPRTKLSKDELGTSLAELNLVINSLKKLRDGSGSLDMHSYVHDLMRPLCIVHCLVQDVLNEVKIEKQDLDDANSAKEEIVELLSCKFIVQEPVVNNKSAILDLRIVSQTRTAHC